VHCRTAAQKRLQQSEGSMFGRSTYHRITVMVVGLGAFVAPCVAAQNTSTSTSAKRNHAPCPTAVSDTSKAKKMSAAHDTSASAKTNCPKVRRRTTTTTSGGSVDLADNTARTTARSSVRIPVSKEPEPAPAPAPAPEPAPAPAPVVAAPVDTPVTPAPTPPPADTAVTPPPPPPQLPKMPKYYSRFY
jgi:hypothetical protein